MYTSVTEYRRTRGGCDSQEKKNNNNNTHTQKGKATAFALGDTFKRGEQRRIGIKSAGLTHVVVQNYSNITYPLSTRLLFAGGTQRLNISTRYPHSINLSVYRRRGLQWTVKVRTPGIFIPSIYPCISLGIHHPNICVSIGSRCVWIHTPAIQKRLRLRHACA